MGTVWLAEQHEPIRRRVALKIIKAGMDSRQVLARFEAERQALALMDHPNIAKVLDAGSTPEGLPFCVMELVKGVPITTFCDEKRLSIRERIELFIPVCQAIQHAHQKGVIHRDLKPGNVLVALGDGRAVPQVIDFGLAKATSQPLTEKTLVTEFGALIGTPEYMSPEQAEMNQLDIDTRSDIYSLGALLYELLTGSTPLSRATLHRAAFDEILRRVREEEPPWPSTRLSQSKDQLAAISAQRRLEPRQVGRLLRGDLDWIVMKCLEKDRSRRYETANGLGRELQRYLDNEPVNARPPSSLYRLQKLLRRNKLACAAGAAAVAALVGGLAFSSWMFFRERAAREIAGLEAERASRHAAAEVVQRRTAEQNAESARLNLYYADMNLVQQALGEGNYGRARSLLERHRPQPGLADQRTWEWRYLWGQCQDDEMLTLGQHTGRVHSVAFDPSGALLASAGGEGTVRLWNLDERRLIREFQHQTGLPVLSCAFAPKGGRLVSAGLDRTVRLWDLGAGKEVTRFDHAAGVRAVAFSPDGQTFATYCLDGTVVVRGAESHQELARFSASPVSAYLCGGLAYSPDGRRLAVTADDGRLHLLDVSNGQPQGGTRVRAGLTAPSYSPDGTLLASGGWDPVARIWELASGRQVAQLTNHKAWVAAALFSPDGGLLATAGADQTVRLWEVGTWRELASLRGHVDELHSAAFSPDGLTLATGCKDGTVKLWNAIPRTVEAEHLHFPAPEHGWSYPQGLGTAVLGKPDGTVRVLNTATWCMRPSFATGISNLSAVEISADRQRLALVTADGGLRLWDCRTGQLGATLREPGAAPVELFGFSPEGRYLAGFIARTNVLLWEVSEARSLGTIEWEGASTSPVFSSDGKQIARGGERGDARVWETATARQLADLRGHPDTVNAVAFSPDGRWLATGADDGYVVLWDWRAGQRASRLRASMLAIGSVAFTQDGLRLVTGGAEGNIRIWGLAGPPQQLLTLKIPRGRVTDLFLLDANTMLAFSDMDCKFRYRALPSTVLDHEDASLPDKTAAGVEDWKARFRFLRQRGRLDEALVAMDRALALDPQEIELWMDKAVLLQQRGQLAQAQPALSNAVTLASENVVAWRGLLQNALGCLRRMQSLEPTNVSVLKQVATLEESLGVKPLVRMAAAPEPAERAVLTRMPVPLIGWELWVRSGDEILRFNPNTGAPLGRAAREPSGRNFQQFVVGPDATLYAANGDGGAVLRLDARTGELLEPAVAKGPPGLDDSRGLALSTNGVVYVSCWTSRQILAFDLASGKPLAKLAERGSPPNFGGRSHQLEIGPDGNLYAASPEDGSIKVFRLPEGQFLRSTVPLRERHGVNLVAFALRADGAIIFADNRPEGGLQWFDSQGGWQGSLVAKGVGGLISPQAVTIAPNGVLYVSDHGSNGGILRFWADTGEFIDQLIPQGLYLDKPDWSRLVHTEPFGGAK